LQLLRSLIQRREVWGSASLDEYLAAAEKKYTAESKVADLMTLQQFLRDRISVETALVETLGCPDAGDQEQVGGDVFAKARHALLRSIIEREGFGDHASVQRIKCEFEQENMKLPPSERFPPAEDEEIRQKLRERMGAPAALAAGVAVPKPETWHARRGALQQLVEKRKKLLAKFDEARVNLLEMRGHQANLDDTTVSALSSDVSPRSDLNAGNFDAYAALFHFDVFMIAVVAQCLLTTSFAVTALIWCRNDCTMTSCPSLRPCDPDSIWLVLLTTRCASFGSGRCFFTSYFAGTT
jgi:hypothetical protein